MDDIKQPERGWQVELINRDTNEVMKYYTTNKLKLKVGDKVNVEIKHAEMDNVTLPIQVLNGEPVVEKTFDENNNRFFTIEAKRFGEAFISIFVPHADEPINGVLYPDTLDFIEISVE